MAIYLYCLTDPGCAPAADLRGLGGAPVRVVPLAGSARSAAWVSDLPGELGPVTPELARIHDRVVRAALSRETPLPARFGQSFAGEEALRRALEARAEAIVHALERVRGGVEMTVRVLLSEPGSAAREGDTTGDAAGRDRASSATGDLAPGDPGGGAPVGVGRAYMDRLRDRQQGSAALRRKAEFLQARVSRAVDAVVREEVCSTVMPGTHSFSLSHLVAREAVGQYRLAVDSLVQGDPSLRLLVSGPWAPYSFTRISDA